MFETSQGQERNRQEMGKNIPKNNQEYGRSRVVLLIVLIRFKTNFGGNAGPQDLVKRRKTTKLKE